MRCWNRGGNSCSRCDFEYLPVPNIKRAYPRENECVKSSESNARLPATDSCKACVEKQLNVKKEEKVATRAHSFCSI